MNHPNNMIPRRRSHSDEDEVLLKSARRCCLCVYLKNNTEQRTGQLAHINHNRSSTSEKHLAWLCLEHHNEYDSTTSQSKNITEGELREYKQRLEQDVIAGRIGRGGTLHTAVGLRFAAIDIAATSSWFSMVERPGSDYTLYSYSWTGANGEGDLPSDKFTDPIFDVTMLAGPRAALVRAVGVEAVSSFNKLSGQEPPVRIKVFDQLELAFRWVPGEVQWVPFTDPVGVSADGHYRFTLRLKGFSASLPGMFKVVRLHCRTESGSVSSDGICLGM